MKRMKRLGLFALFPPTAATLLAVVTIALAVGANLVVITLVRALWLPATGMDRPDRLVLISTTSSDGASMSDQLRARDIALVAEQAVFAAVASEVAATGLLHDYRPQLVLDNAGALESAAVGSGYFTALGVRLIGRDFLVADEQPGAPLVAAIGERAWRRFFGARTDIVGLNVPSSHGPAQIVAVVPHAFRGSRLGDAVELWIPAGQAISVSAIAQAPGDIAAAAAEAARMLTPHIAIGRLAPGATVADATIALAGQSDRFVVRPLQEVYARRDGAGRVLSEGRLLTTLMAAATLILLAGCTTLATLAVVQFDRRRHDMAVRLALGASRRGLTGAALVDLVVVAVAGGAAALVVAAVGLRVISAFTLPGGLSLDRVDLDLDLTLGIIGLAGAVVVMVIASAAPLFKATREPATAWLRASVSSAGKTSLRLRRVAVAAHAAGTVMVLIGALLLSRVVISWLYAGPGFDLDRTMFVSVQPTVVEFAAPGEGDEQAGMARRRLDALERLAATLARLPGVSAVAVGSVPIRPVDTLSPRLSTVSTGGATHHLDVRFASGGRGYLQALGLRRLAAHDIDDVAAEQNTVMVTRALADRLWPGASPLGETAEIDGRLIRVGGIVDDVVIGSLRQPSRFAIISPMTMEAMANQSMLSLVVRTGVPPDAIAPAIRRTINEIFHAHPRVVTTSGAALARQEVGRERLGAWFFSGFGLVALLLALTAVFGLADVVVHGRRRELGIRLSLGAVPGRLMTGVALHTVRPVVIGTILGLSVALAAARWTSGLLPGVDSFHVSSYAGAAGLLVSGAWLAAYVAALRIRRLALADVLRSE